MTPSPYQQAVYDHVANFPETPNLLVEAVAGSGKTTTLVGALAGLPAGLSTVMLAFNKKIATELALRVPRGVACKTFHSLAFAAYRAVAPRHVEVEGRKSWNILKGKYGHRPMTKLDLHRFGAFAVKLSGLAKQQGLGALEVVTPRALRMLARHHDLVLRDKKADYDTAFGWTMRLLARSIDVTDVVDFDDMLYMPLALDVGFHKQDVILVDEAQDTNLIQAEIVRRMSHDTTRVVFVGDPRQAIYGFRGADSGAMDRLAEEFDCERLPLSVCYRCAQAIVREAKVLAPEIEVHEANTEGVIEEVDEWTPTDFSPADSVLCRNVAPLLTLAYRCIAAEVPVQILGRDIGKGLIDLVERFRAPTVDGMLANLVRWGDREIEAAKRDDREDKIDSILDRVECIRIVAEGADSVDTIASKITALFSDGQKRVLTLSTIHRSKGMEWPAVWILDAHLMPSPWARRPWMKVQEANLEYVAITRAEYVLRYITTPSKK